MEDGTSSSSNATTPENAAETKITKPAPGTAASPLQCRVCDKILSTRSAFNCHIKCHAADKCQIVCSLCDLEFSHVLKLRQHMQDMHTNADGQFPCPKCVKVFADFQKLKKHMRNMHSGQHFECEQCAKCFARLDQLRLHQLTHSDERRFGCHICERRFKRKDKLKEHCKRVHDFVLKTPREKPRSGNAPAMQCEQQPNEIENKSDHASSSASKESPLTLEIRDNSRVFSKRRKGNNEARGTQPTHTGEAVENCQTAATADVSRLNAATATKFGLPAALSAIRQYPSAAPGDHFVVLHHDKMNAVSLPNFSGISFNNNSYPMRPPVQHSTDFMQNSVPGFVQNVVTTMQTAMPSGPHFKPLDLVANQLWLTNPTEPILRASFPQKLYPIRIQQQNEQFQSAVATTNVSSTAAEKALNYSHKSLLAGDAGENAHSPFVRTPIGDVNGENWILVRRDMHCGGSYETASASSLAVSSSVNSAPPFPVGFPADGHITGFDLQTSVVVDDNAVLPAKDDPKNSSSVASRVSEHLSERACETTVSLKSSASSSSSGLPLESAIGNKNCAIISEDSLRQLLNRFADDVPDSMFSKPPSIAADRNLSLTPNNFSVSQRRDSAAFTNLLLSASEKNDDETERDESSSSNDLAPPLFTGDEDSLPNFTTMTSDSVGFISNAMPKNHMSIAGFHPALESGGARTLKKHLSEAVTAGSDPFNPATGERSDNDDEGDDATLMPPFYMGDEECNPFGACLPNDSWLIDGSTKRRVSDTHSVPLSNTATTADIYVRRLSLNMEVREW